MQIYQNTKKESVTGNSKESINVTVRCFIGDDFLSSSPSIPISTWKCFKNVTEGISRHLHILHMTV